LYYDYIKAQRAEVASMLDRIPELESSTGAARAEQTNARNAN
jgi:hypothetical protein